MPSSPKRGEIWLVNLDPTVGAEIQKTRPTIVISSDYIGKLPLKLVVPITDWKASFVLDLWHIRLDPTEQNGLTKPSAADALQSRSLDTRRFIRKLGTLTDLIPKLTTNFHQNGYNQKFRSHFFGIHSCG